MLDRLAQAFDSSICGWCDFDNARICASIIGTCVEQSESFF